MAKKYLIPLIFLLVFGILGYLLYYRNDIRYVLLYYRYNHYSMSYKKYCPPQDFMEPSCICIGLVKKFADGGIMCTGISKRAPSVAKSAK